MPIILLINPNKDNNHLLKKLLLAASYQVLEADNCDDALALYQSHPVNLVVTEVELTCSSQECASVESLIQALKCTTASKRLVSILVVTASYDVAKIKSALSVGADAFLESRYVDDLFIAKVQSLLRNSAFYDDLMSTKRTIAKLHQNLEMEHRAAENIFDRFVYGPSNNLKGVQVKLSPASIFNGDLFLSAVSPSGNLFTLLGDFTGHGLPAAIGSIPIAEVFYSMVKKGFSLEVIMPVINDKLKAFLPSHIFFGAIAFQVSPRLKLAKVMNAGMQPLLMLDVENQTAKQFESRFLPLGVLSAKEMALDFVSIPLKGNEVFVFYSDGVVEAENKDGEFFGVDGVVNTLLANDVCLDGLFDTAKAFSEGGRFDDDVSLIKVDAQALMFAEPEMYKLHLDNLHNTNVGHWQQTFCFDAQTIKSNSSIVETMVDAIISILPIVRHKEELFIVFSEIYSNILEHGILGLESGLKAEFDGFQKYLKQKELALESLKDVFLQVNIENNPISPISGELRIEFSHQSGTVENHFLKPFVPFQCVNLTSSVAPSDSQFFGRGNLLLSTICKSVCVSDDGSHLIAVVAWGEQTQAVS